jgi:hypothetical protein
MNTVKTELHGTKSQETSTIDTTVKASQKTVFFEEGLLLGCYAVWFL